jgi:hypothetical protein
VPDDSAPVSDVDVSPVLARAMASAVRRAEPPPSIPATVAMPAAAPAKPAWSVSIYRGGVGRVQTIDAR